MMFSNTLNNDQKALIIQIIITTTSSSIFFLKTCVFKFPKTAMLSFHHPCGHRCACFMNPKVILHIHVFFFVFAQSKNISKQILVNEAYCPFKMSTLSSASSYGHVDLHCLQAFFDIMMNS